LYIYVILIFKDYEAWKKEGFCKNHKGFAIGKVEVKGKEAITMLEVSVEIFKGIAWIWKEGLYKKGMLKMMLELLMT
jgi:hypothetical protein